MYKILNCTKEVLKCIEYSKQIALKYDSSYVLKSKHLILGLILKSSLIQKILKVEYIDHSKEDIIFKSIYNNVPQVQRKESEILFSIDILEILNILNNLRVPFNTVTLFYFLYKRNYTLSNLIFKILDIKFQSMNISQYLSERYIYIPKYLKSILKVIKKTQKNLIKRERELSIIQETLNRKLSRNILLVGEDGIGKYSIIEQLSDGYNIKMFVELNVLNFYNCLNNKLDLINYFFNFIENNPNIIICCKDIHTLFDSSNIEHNYIRLMLLEKLRNSKIQIIGTTTPHNYSKLLEEYSDLKFIFTKINIKEPEKSLLISILKQYINIYKQSKQVLIFDDVLEDLIELTDKSIKDYYFPRKGFLIIDSLFNKYSHIKEQYIITKKEILDILKDYTYKSNTSFIKDSENLNDINNLELELKRKIYGQDIAITKIVSSLKRARIGLKDKNKPIGSWLLCGPSGTGKTELVKSLAKMLFGSERELIRFDMSEYMEKHSISKLIGSPPGYVGFEEGGLLTDAVKKKPYSIVLFDEIEKAHKDINNIMLQLLDEGILTNSKGEHIDFTNTLIIYTSNLGCPTSPLEFKSFKEGTEISKEEYKSLSKKVDKAVKSFFRPEFLNRLSAIIVFKPLSINCLSNILDKFIYNLLNKLRENNISLRIELDKDIKNLLAKISYHPLYGARPLKRTVEEFIEKPISDLILSYKFKTSHIMFIYIDKKKNNINYLLKKY